MSIFIVIECVSNRLVILERKEYVVGVHALVVELTSRSIDLVHPVVSTQDQDDKTMGRADNQPFDRRPVTEYWPRHR